VVTNIWTCPKCQTKVDDSFQVCWSCGTSADGKGDPAFARADDIVPTPDPPWKSNNKTENGLDLELTKPEAEPRIKVVECYWAAEPCEASFLASQLMLEGIPATSDTYDLRLVFAGFYGFAFAGPYFGPRVRVFARDLPRAQSWLARYEERRAKRKWLRERR
jgi:hypothetical protein